MIEYNPSRMQKRKKQQSQIENNIGVEGANAIAQALSKNSTLTSLTFSCIE